MSKETALSNARIVLGEAERRLEGPVEAVPARVGRDRVD